MNIMLCQKTKQAFFGNVFLRKKRTKHPATENPVKKEETKTHCSFNGDTVVGQGKWNINRKLHLIYNTQNKCLLNEKQSERENAGW